MAVPQSVDLSSLENCANLETPELKLSCFEAIIANSNATEVEAPGAAKSTAATPPSVQAETAPSAAPVSAVPANSVAPKVGASETVAPVAESVSAAPVRVESAEVSAIATASTSAEAEFEQEYIERAEEHKEKENDENVRATVVDVSKGRNDILYFHLGNGQVWRQNEARHYPYPRNGEFDVTISRGMMGEYRMRIGDNGRMVRIRRIK